MTTVVTIELVNVQKKERRHLRLSSIQRVTEYNCFAIIMLLLEAIMSYSVLKRILVWV
jgi:hypothetical protein